MTSFKKGFYLKSHSLICWKILKMGVNMLEDEELVVDTPWGKLITAKGLQVLLTGFANDFDSLNKNLSSINTRLTELESILQTENPNSRMQAIEGTLKSLENEINKIRNSQTQFAKHIKKTFKLFYTRLDELISDLPQSDS